MERRSSVGFLVVGRDALWMGELARKIDLWVLHPCHPIIIIVEHRLLPSVNEIIYNRD
jgi:hypothetical protein